MTTNKMRKMWCLLSKVCSTHSKGAKVLSQVVKWLL